MSRGDDVRLDQALTENARLRAQRDAQRQAGVRRWLAANPGEALRDCIRATGAPKSMVRRLAAELGHGGLKRYPVVRRWKAATEGLR